MLGRLTGTVLSLTVFLVVFAQTARADLFTVSGIFVDVTAESASAARTQALSQARVVGFNRLLRRLTQSADHGLLPQIPSSDLESYVSSFRVTDEKTAPDRYIALVTMQFKPQPVRDVLNFEQITFTESRALPVLIVPVMTRANETSIWTDTNSWLEGWARIDASQHLVPTIAPFGDIEDVVLLSPSQALAFDTAALTALAERYGAESAIVADGRLTEDAGAGKRFFSVSIGSVGPDRVAPFDMSFEGPLDDDVNQFMAQVADQILSRIEEGWKVATIESFSEEFQLTALITFNNMQEWLEIASRLRGVNLVRAQKLSALTVRDAVVVVTHVGEPDMLNRSMARAGLQMQPQPDGFWVITRLDQTQ